MFRNVTISGTLLALLLTSTSSAADPRTVANKVDELLNKELAIDMELKRPRRTNDEVFLKRVFLDIVGETPTADDVLAFALDSSKSKRQDIVTKLLKDDGYAKNWARYWRDVIMYRRTEQRSGLVVPAMTEFLTEQFSENASWDKIAKAFMTASGDVRENGATGLIMAQGGRPEDTVAEISRIFVGIQIQCAQCHDHPTDSWKREQFHRFAAFFPRVAIRPNRSTDRRTFNVVVNDQPFDLRLRKNNNNRYRGTPEHYMPNLEAPSEKGTLMQPVFFIGDKALDMGKLDSERRTTLAKWITSPQNEWFAKAFVNRMWSEFVGEGFYEPVDDIGPERDCQAPETVSYLAAQFAENGYNIHWLIKTIVATETYQRTSLPRRGVEDLPFIANCPQRLRADQLFDSLKAALDFAEPPGRTAGAYGQRFSARTQFNTVFGYDPSERREEVSGSIAQALLFMNSPIINRSIDARRNAGLGAILRAYPDNRQAIQELYLKALARRPTTGEIKTCLAYIKDVEDRNEAFEDLLWALINSTEFLYRK